MPGLLEGRCSVKIVLLIWSKETVVSSDRAMKIPKSIYSVTLPTRALMRISIRFWRISRGLFLRLWPQNSRKNLCGYWRAGSWLCGGKGTLRRQSQHNKRSLREKGDFTLFYLKCRLWISSVFLYICSYRKNISQCSLEFCENSLCSLDKGE